MAEWTATDSEELMDILTMYYPSGPFRMGIDNDILYIVPAELSMDENIKILEENIGIDEIPAYLGVLGQPEKIFVWVDEQTSEFQAEEEDALEIEIGKNEEKENDTAEQGGQPMEFTIEKPDLEEDIAFLTQEIKKVKSENVELDSEVVKLSTLIKSLDISLAELFKKAGGDLHTLPSQTDVRLQTVIEFLKSKI